MIAALPQFTTIRIVLLFSAILILDRFQRNLLAMKVTVEFVFNYRR